MPPVEWKQAARADLWAIVDYISDDNLEAAQALKYAIEATASRLPDHPQMHRQGRVAGTREIIIKRNYLLVYCETQARSLFCALCTPRGNDKKAWDNNRKDCKTAGIPLLSFPRRGLARTVPYTEECAKRMQPVTFLRRLVDSRIFSSGKADGVFPSDLTSRSGAKKKRRLTRPDGKR